MNGDKRIGAKHIDNLRCRGDWEMKRGILRVMMKTDAGIFEEFLISMDTIVKALKISGVMFVAEKKRVHEHLKVEERV